MSDVAILFYTIISEYVDAYKTDYKDSSNEQNRQ